MANSSRYSDAIRTTKGRKMNRGEKLWVLDGNEWKEATYEFRVENLEPLGSHSVMLLDGGGRRVVCSCKTSTVEPSSKRAAVKYEVACYQAGWSARGEREVAKKADLAILDNWAKNGKTWYSGQIETSAPEEFRVALSDEGRRGRGGWVEYFHGTSPAKARRKAVEWILEDTRNNGEKQ